MLWSGPGEVPSLWLAPATEPPPLGLHCRGNTAHCAFPVQVGRRGHCSVEDARATLDLYKLVEGEWEQQLHAALTEEDAPPSFAASNHYMQDEYWPCDVIAESQ